MDLKNGINIIPDNEVERVSALARYQIVGTKRETAFDSICELACDLFGVPISHISFLDADTEHIKAEIGLNGLQQVGRAEGFCAYAILQPEILLIEDARLHPIFANHPYVISEIKIRFYAAAPVITTEGFIIGTLCLIDQHPRTMTEKEKAIFYKLARMVMEQTELRHNNIDLLQQRDEFISLASHELRTPLTALKAAAQILHYKENKGDETLVGQVNKSVIRLSNLVNDIFDASRLTERSLHLNRTPFVMATLIENCRQIIQLVEKIKLTVNGDGFFSVIADEQKIERVVINMIENAVKYAPGSPVTVTVEKLPGFIKTCITDYGPGISAEKLPHIFRRYYRSEHTSWQTGLGLGLYFSAEIVKQHGGEIGVESQSGNGCTFWFTLPVSG